MPPFSVVCVWIDLPPSLPPSHGVLFSLTAFYLFVSVSVFSTSHRHFSSSPHCAFSACHAEFQLTNKSKHRLPSINHITHTGRESERESPISLLLFFFSPLHQFYTEYGRNNLRGDYTHGWQFVCVRLYVCEITNLLTSKPAVTKSEHNDSKHVKSYIFKCSIYLGWCCCGVTADFSNTLMSLKSYQRSKHSTAVSHIMRKWFYNSILYDSEFIITINISNWCCSCVCLHVFNWPTHNMLLDDVQLCCGKSFVFLLII